MDTLLWLIQNHGYTIVFFFTLLEGETIVALAGFAAYQGYLHLDVLIPVVILGALMGDEAFFYFGRYKGRQFLANRPRLEAKVEHIHVLLEKYHGWIIFGSRFMYGFRIVLPIALGASKVSGLKFFVYNFLGAVVWAIIFTFGGYVFGNAIEHFLGHMKKFEGIIMGGVFALFVIIQLGMYIKRRFGKKD